MAWAALLVLGALVLGHLSTLMWAQGRDRGHWLPAFAPALTPWASPDEAATRTALAGHSLRQFAPLVLPGRRVRVRLSNEHGDAPLVIGEARVAWRATGGAPLPPDGTETTRAADAPSARSAPTATDSPVAPSTPSPSGATGAPPPRFHAIAPGSDRPLTFDGRAALALAPGESRLSDAIDLPEPPPSAAWAAARPADLAITLHFPGAVPRLSRHEVGARSAYRSSAGPHRGDVAFPVASVARDLLFVSEVWVDAPRTAALWVAFGDSITDGAWHRVDTDGSWPARWLAAWAPRQQALQRLGSARGPVGVLNAGLGGNRLLTPDGDPQRVVPGDERLARGPLTWPGVRGIVMAIGLNDIGSAPRGAEADRADALIARLSERFTQLRQRGVAVVAATLTPVQGSFYDRPAVEAARQRVNDWLRRQPEAGVVDAVVDFDAVVRDPARPGAFRDGFHIDHLHPSDRGYQAMADALVAVLDRAGLGLPRACAASTMRPSPAKPTTPALPGMSTQTHSAQPAVDCPT